MNFKLPQRPSICSLSLLILFSCTNAFSSPPLSEVVFRGLSNEDRLAAVLSCVRWRDAQLASCSYRLQTSMFKRGLGEKMRGSRVIESETLNFQRDGERLSLQQTEMLPEDGGTRSLVASWDGKLSRTYVSDSRREKGNAHVGDTEDDKFSEAFYNQMLGVRMYFESGTTLADFLDRVAAQHRIENVDVLGKADGWLIRVRYLYAKAYFFDFVFDPRRDYMVVEFDSRRGSENGKAWGYSTGLVEEAKQIDGLWVPMLVSRYAANSAVGSKERQYEGGKVWEVIDFERKVVDGNVFNCVFPPNTDVVNSVDHVGYTIKRDGSIVPFSIMNAETGQSSIATRQAAVESYRSLTTQRSAR